MKKGTMLGRQPFMRKLCAALSANLPSALRDLGYQLTKDSERGWRTPGYGGLIVWQRDNETWGWSHFSSGRSGDTISFLTHWQQMNKKEAVEALIPYGNLRIIKSISPASKSRSVLRNANIPPHKWIENASKLIKICRNELWESKGLKVWDWLHGRGLKDKTIRSARFGWNKNDYYFRREKWGLQSGNEGPTKCSCQVVY
jgi:hypothetical protein